ncbi:MAG: class I SAM-dependent methyltransferase [Planctomycetaceae bacterium]|nr:class I SAM-dependent methyltransferase [Planctomycetaceae bacterium]
MTIYDSLALPPPFHRGSANFWDEPHISEQLLKAHLDPNFEGASRKLGFIDRSVAWITASLPPDRHRDLLDVGCGPGLYAERLHDNGYHVTGIDFSRRSIDYAREQAKRTGRTIEYRYGNYLEMDYAECFDLAMLIYCDYGALSPGEGARLLRLIHNSLRDGGTVLLDVFTMAKLAGFREERGWSSHENGGFWRPDSHFTIQNNCIYDQRTTLEQTVVVSRESTQPYYIWHRYFDRETIAAELAEAGFHNFAFFSDVTGVLFSEGSETLAIRAQKQ